MLPSFFESDLRLGKGLDHYLRFKTETFFVCDREPNLGGSYAYLDYILERVRKKDVRIVFVDPDFIKREWPVPLPTNDELRARAGGIKELLDRQDGILLQCPHSFLRVPLDDVRVELGPLFSEPTMQLPYGELFFDFDCNWSADLLAQVPADDEWLDFEITARNGYILRASEKRFTQSWIGKRLTEFGVGLNHLVSERPSPWEEKRAGAMHVGLGPRGEFDISPIQLHSDIQLIADPERALSLSCALCR